MSQVGRQHGRRAALVLASLLAAVPAAAQPRAYLVEGDALAVVDLDENRVLDRIPLVDRVADLAVSPDGATAYALGNRHLQIIDLRAGVVRTVHRVWGEYPPDGRITLSPAGDRLYLSATDYLGSGSRVDVFDAVTDTFAASIDLPIPPGSGTTYLVDFALSADGRRAHALLEMEDRDAGFWLLLREIDLASGATVGERRVVTTAQHFGSGLVLAEEGRAIVGSDRGLLAIDLDTGQVVGETAGPGWARPYWDAVHRRFYAWRWDDRGGRETARLYAVDLARGRARELARFRGWVGGLELLPEGGAFIAHLPGPPARTVLLAADSGAVIEELAGVGAIGAVGFGVPPAAPAPRPTPRPSPTPALPSAAQVLAIDGDRQVLAEIDSAAPAVARVTGEPALSGVRGVATSPDGRRLYAITFAELRLIDVGGAAGVERIAFDDLANGVTAVAAAPDGATIWVAHHGGLRAIDASAPHRQEPVTLDGPLHALTLSADGRTLYVADGYGSSGGGPGTLHVVDAIARRSRATIAIPGGATAVAVAGERVFVAGEEGSVAVVDPAAAVVEAVIPVPPDVRALAASGDGARLYVVGGSSSGVQPPTLSVVDTATLRRDATLELAAAGRVRGLVLSPDGQRALVSLDGGPPRVVVVDLARLQVVATLPSVGGYLAIGRAAWTAPPTPTPLPRQTPGARRPCMLVPHGVGAGPLDGTITLVDPLAHAVAGSIRVGGLSPDTSYGEVYDGVVNVAADPGGRRLYALLWPYVGGNSWLVAIDPRSRAEIARLPVGGYAHSLAVTPDGDRAFVAASAGDVRTVVSVDLRAWRVLDEVAVDGAISGPYASADGARLYFRGERYEDGAMVAMLTAVDAVTLDVAFELTLPVGASPQGGIAVLPDGRTLLVDVGGETTGRDLVAVVDVDPPSVAAVIEVPATSWSGRVWGGSDFAVSADGREVYRTTGVHPGMLTVFDPAARQVGAQIADSQRLYAPSFTPDGAFLYAATGDLAVFDVTTRQRVASVGVGGSAGDVVAAEIDGDCEALDVPWTPTATPTQGAETPAPTATPPPTWSGVWQGVEVVSTSGARGATLPVEVRLSADGAEVSGVEARIAFAPPLAVAADDEGNPRCRVNPAIDKPASAFVFHPVGCHSGPCRAVKALVLSLADVAPIADGAVLFTCDVAIAADAVAGVYPLRVTEVGASDPSGNPLPALGRSGTVTVNAATGHRSSSAAGGQGTCAVVEPSAAGWAWWPIGAALALMAIRGRRR